MELLKELCETPGISGREQAIIEILKRELGKSCNKVTVDDVGNVIGYKKAKKKNALKVMVSGHMDEIGFIVSHIDSNGFIRFVPRGGHVPKVLISQRVKVYGKKELTGVVEAAPSFLHREDRLKVAEIKNMFIDVGMTEKQVKKIIDIGDPIVFDRKFEEQGDVFISKAFDDRAGCYVLLEAMKRLSKKQLDVEIYAVGSSMEEIGIKGARGAAKDIRPDIGIALDVTAAFDTPGVTPDQHVTKLGDGAAIKINDMASISNHGIVKFLKQLAQKNKIKHQMEILPFGGTDASGMQMFGKGAVATLSVPTRYIHSPNEVLHKKDLEATIRLLVKFLENASKCKLEF